MMTKPITLEDIQAQQSKLSEMIAEFEAQTKVYYVIPKATIVLHPGERYAGIILDEEGNPAYHLILLPGEKQGIAWAAAKDWAAEQGGTLPTRSEQSLLFANLKDQFTSNYYWSSEQHKDTSEYAWFQRFYYGFQNCLSVGSQLRARVVRRVYVGES